MGNYNHATLAQCALQFLGAFDAESLHQVLAIVCHGFPHFASPLSISLLPITSDYLCPHVAARPNPQVDWAVHIYIYMYCLNRFARIKGVNKTNSSHAHIRIFHHGFSRTEGKAW